MQLSAWSRPRRVIVLRRQIKGDVLIAAKDDPQGTLAFVESRTTAAAYAYAVLVTSTDYELRAAAQLYRERADAENNFDELENQWGWGGFTTHDLKRCCLVASMVALIYNWWNLFLRLANPHKHHEAITSRLLLLHGVTTKAQYGGQTALTRGGPQPLDRIPRSLSGLSAGLIKRRDPRTLRCKPPTVSVDPGLDDVSHDYRSRSI